MAAVERGIQVNPDEQVRQAFMKRAGVDSLFGPDETLAKFGKDHGISVITTAPGLLAYAREHETCVHGFPNARRSEGHWNPEGHAEAGRIMARAMCASSL